MTPEQRQMWEQERDKKDKHNDSMLPAVMYIFDAVHLEPKTFLYRSRFDVR